MSRALCEGAAPPLGAADSDTADGPSSSPELMTPCLGDGAGADGLQLWGPFATASASKRHRSEPQPTTVRPPEKQPHSVMDNVTSVEDVSLLVAAGSDGCMRPETDTAEVPDASARNANQDVIAAAAAEADAATAAQPPPTGLPAGLSAGLLLPPLPQQRLTPQPPLQRQSVPAEVLSTVLPPSAPSSATAAALHPGCGASVPRRRRSLGLRKARYKGSCRGCLLVFRFYCPSRRACAPGRLGAVA